MSIDIQEMQAEIEGRDLIISRLTRVLEEYAKFAGPLGQDARDVLGKNNPGEDE